MICVEQSLNPRVVDCPIPVTNVYPNSIDPYSMFWLAILIIVLAITLAITLHNYWERKK